MDQPREDERPEAFKRHGTEEQRVQIDAHEVLEAIAEGRDIDIKYAVIRGDLDIGEIRDRLKKDERRNAVIPGTVTVTSSHIEKAPFSRATFSQGADFSLAVFSETADFRRATFSETADFSDAEFCGDASFTLATFTRGPSFYRAAFEGQALFDVATFGGEASFNKAVFHANAFFWRAVFTGPAFFYFTTFEREVSFNRAGFRDAAFFAWTSFPHLADFGAARMTTPADFTGTRFQENTSRVGLHNDIWCPLVSWITGGRMKPRKRLVTDFSGFNTATIMDSSSNPYLKRYIDDEQWIRSWRERSRWHKFLFVLWELSCHCGRSFGLWLFWSLVLAFVFGLVFAPYHAPSWLHPDIKALLRSLDPHLHVSPLGRVPTLLTPYYFSVVTFTTLGFGDVTPLNLAGEIWLAIEVLLGYVMLGGLISILANKLARRS